ncbi:MAG: prepilin-type N-terminal cleavage/methylation domain-containing protein [Hyphomicrobiaceae bacterium]|nr:prepilin-type N-terminal cleavage/methylation domain-containing protein [Hyphomicrobiaceae bacterium]
MATRQKSIRHRCGEAGFTLVEVLVGLSLLAILMALLPGAVRLGMVGWQVRGEIERDSALDLSLRLVLEQRVVSAMPVQERDVEGRVGIAFSGDATSLSFVAEAANGPFGAGVYRHRLQPSASGAAAHEGTGLRLRLQLYVPSQSADASVEGPVDVVEQGAIVRFRYFGAHGDGGAMAWHDAWRSRTRLPRLVEATTTLPGGAPHLTRRAIVALRLEAPP